MPRTLNDIIPPSKRRQIDFPPADASAPSPETSYTQPEQQHFSIPRRSFPWGALITTIIIIGVAVGALYAFANAKVEVTPASASVTLSSATFTATPSSGDLPFELVTVDKVASKSVPAESTSTVNQPAQGTITIYNTQAKPQTLVAKTRFETAGGLVFRIKDPVSVPGGTTAAPGTVKATVYADANGDQYNVGPSNFTLPGLANSPQFTQVYAKSTDPFSGGFAGTRPVVSQATADAEHAALKAALATDLASAITAQAPAGYVFIPGGSFSTYVEQPDGVDTNGQVVVTEKGTVQAVVFPAQALATAVARQGAPGYVDRSVVLEHPATLKLAPADASAPSATAPFAFTLSGTATLVAGVDAQKVAAAIAGKTKKEADAIFKTMPEIDHAVGVLRPFWRGSFPQDPAKIKVVITAP